MKKVLYTLIITVTSTGMLSAQNLGEFLEGGVADGEQILQDYLEPAFTGFGYALNSGWYNTGKPHKTLGFDLTITGNFALVPDEALFYSVNPANYTNITTESGTTTDGYPTIMGPNLNADDIPYLIFNEGTDDEFKVTAPTGLGLDEGIVGLNGVPAPTVQLGIGIFKNTEVKLRLIPEQTFGDAGTEFSTKMFGLGVMHDVKQWIPGIKNLPFDLSGFFAFSKMENTFQFDEENPDRIAEFNASGTTLQAIISKKLAILTVYGGLGFSTSNIEYNMLGDYNDEGETSIPEDPITLEYNNGGLRANAGARIKLLIFTFHAEYALQEYNTFSAGFGLSIR